MANFRVDYVKLEALAKRLGVSSSDGDNAHQSLIFMHNDVDYNKSAMTVDICDLLEAILNSRTESDK